MAQLALWCLRAGGVALWWGLLGPVAQASAIYSCEDSSGRKLTADRPIAACADREQRVLRGTGGEKGRLGPSLSEQDALTREQQARDAREQERLAQESQRKERALAQRYPQPALHDAARKEALEQIDERLQGAMQRIEALRLERGKLAKEMEFYAGDPTLAPSSVKSMLNDTERALSQQLSFHQNLQSERKSLLRRFDAERTVLQPYWQKNASENARAKDGALPTVPLWPPRGK